MSWARRTRNDMGMQFEANTLPSSATTEYTSVINFLKPRNDGTNQYVYFSFEASAVSGTNLDIALYGATTSGGTKYLLKDAVVADITDGTKVVGQIDLNAYPAPFYYIAWTSDADESANTITVEVFPEYPNK